MPGKTARALCPVCQEPMPPDETECDNCGAFVIDEAVVRLCRALGIPREKALALFEKGFRHPNQLQDRNVDDVLQKGENGLLFLCTNCGGFVATGDPKCPRCGAEFEVEPEAPTEEKDILDLLLCPVCGADNEATTKECEICGEPLGGMEPPPSRPPVPEPEVAQPGDSPDTSTLDWIDGVLEELDRPAHADAEVRLRPIAKLAKVVRRPRTPVAVPRAKRSKRPPNPPALKQTPVKAPPTGPAARPKPVPRAAHRPSAAHPSPSKAIRAPSPRAAPKKAPHDARRRPRNATLPSELTGGLAVAGAASLYLSQLLNQPTVAWGVAFVATVLAAYATAATLLRPSRSLRRGDATPLLAGAVLSAAAPAFPQTGALLFSAAGAAALAWAMRRILHTDARDLIIAAAAVPLVVLGIVTGLDLPFAGTVAWAFALLALVPWPAAVAAFGLRQGRLTMALGRELSKAQRDMDHRDYAQSVKDFDRAIALGGRGAPGEDMPWYGKGASLIVLGRYEEALRAIDKALDLNPRNEVAWLNKGNALTKMGRLVDALRCYNAAIKVNPRYEVAWNNKGNTLARIGHHQEALTCYERALEIDPGYRGAWVNKGYVLTKLGRYDEATTCADRALRLNEGLRTGAA